MIYVAQGVGESPTKGNRNFSTYVTELTPTTKIPHRYWAATYRTRSSAVLGRFALPNRNPNVVALSS